MLDTTKAKKIGDNIYVYNNFVSNEELKNIISYANNISETSWYEQDPSIKWMLRTENLEILNNIRNRIINLMSDDLKVGSNTALIKMKKGYAWGVHQDDYEFKDLINDSKLYVEGQPFDLVDVSAYGLIVYFNEFLGGEIYYPEQNIEYKPLPGDLLIHGSDEKCKHGVREVFSEFRLSYSNHISKKVKILKK